MGSRYYNPATGTFVSQDPIGFASGTTNLYQFVNDDPVDLNDPTRVPGLLGLYPSAWGAIIGVGLALGIIAVIAVRRGSPPSAWRRSRWRGRWRAGRWPAGARWWPPSPRERPGPSSQLLSHP